MAGPTRLELATSGVTGRRSNQLNYDPAPDERKQSTEPPGRLSTGLGSALRAATAAMAAIRSHPARRSTWPRAISPMKGNG